MTDAQALHKLRTAPGYFLKRYPINPAGATLGILPNQANPAQFKIYKPNNPGGKLGHLGATRPGTVLPFLIHDISSFRVAPAANVPPFYGGAQSTALVVPMVYWNQIPLNLGAPDVGALDGYLLDGGADIMITGQLSNCCFRFVVKGAGLACTHRNPRGSPAGPVQMQQDLTANARFANYAGALGAYGGRAIPATRTRSAYACEGRGDFMPSHRTIGSRRLPRAARIDPGPVTPI